MTSEGNLDTTNGLLFSSAVLCLSPTTEIPRNRTLDTIVLEIIVSKGLEKSSSVKDVYDALDELVAEVWGLTKEELKDSCTVYKIKRL